MALDCRCRCPGHRRVDCYRPTSLGDGYRPSRQCLVSERARRPSDANPYFSVSNSVSNASDFRRLLLNAVVRIPLLFTTVLNGRERSRTDPNGMTRKGSSNRDKPRVLRVNSLPQFGKAMKPAPLSRPRNLTKAHECCFRSDPFQTVTLPVWMAYRE